MYTITLVKVAGAFGLAFLLISVLQRFRSRKEQTRSKEAAAQAAAAKRFEEVFGTSPHTGRAEVIARIKTVITALSLKLTQDPSHYEEHRTRRLEAIHLAEHFGFSVLTGRQAQEQARRARRRLAVTSRQTGGATGTAA
ncbi:MAG: hypothetical protein AAB417_01675 [Patescibacteria group bacterium]